jgi:hypothetical protein
MPESESDREGEKQVADVTKEFLEKTDSEFHDFLAGKKEHLKIDLDLSDIISTQAKLNSLRHFLFEGETRKLVVRATQAEADEFKKLFPTGTEWEIISE